MRQAAAIFLDAYRELNARRMFWIALIISGLVDMVLLLIGLDAKHNIRIAWWSIPFPVPPMIDLAMLLKTTFISVGVNLWLTWAATILAIISTASIIPDFLSGGSIDLVLSKPIGRLRLFLLKYLSGLLFVAAQVVVFAGLAFLIIGFRAGTWEPGLLLAIPMVLVFFSYLYCVCALVGVLTRSTIASLLFTILFWLALFAMNTTEKLLTLSLVPHEMYVEKLEQRVEAVRAEGSESALTHLQDDLAEARGDRDSLRKWRGLALAAKTSLPKTDDTMNLLRLWVVSTASLPEDGDHDAPNTPFLSTKMRMAGVRPAEVIRRTEQSINARNPWWIIGTSLVFEMCVLGLAAWIFARRDF